MLLILLILLSGCATHPGTLGFCIDEFNFITNTLPFLQGYYDWLHNRFHSKEHCHLNKPVCCKKEMEKVTISACSNVFWRKEKDKWIYYKSSTYLCNKCKLLRNIAIPTNK